MAVLTLAEQRSLPPDIMTDNQQESESYWRHEQDYLDDVVRQMSKRCDDRDGHPDLWAHCHVGKEQSLAYPNVFITVAPAEWMFPLHSHVLERYKRAKSSEPQPELSEVQGLVTLHLYNVMMTVMTLLLGWTGPSGFFEKVFEHVIRVECKHIILCKNSPWEEAGGARSDQGRIKTGSETMAMETAEQHNVEWVQSTRTALQHVMSETSG